MGRRREIRVTDTGEGIAPALLPYVFDRFRQGDASVTRPHGGLGLGLSIVRHIVELHGGQVHASSDGPGQGRVLLGDAADPGRARRVAVQGRRRIIRSAACGFSWSTMTPMRGRWCRWRWPTAARGREARASAREALQLLPDFRPDVLVSDISMPGEDGYALIRRIRALAAARARRRPRRRTDRPLGRGECGRALTAGFQQFIPKPVEVDQLARVVRSLAHQRR